MGKKNENRIAFLKKRHKALVNRLLEIDEEDEREFDQVHQEVVRIENRLVHSFNVSPAELLANSDDCIMGESA